MFAFDVVVKRAWDADNGEILWVSNELQNTEQIMGRAWYVDLFTNGLINIF